MVIKGLTWSRSVYIAAYTVWLSVAWHAAQWPWTTLQPRPAGRPSTLALWFVVYGICISCLKLACPINYLVIECGWNVWAVNCTFLWETELHNKSSKHRFSNKTLKNKNTNPCLYSSSFRYLTKTLRLDGTTKSKHNKGKAQVRKTARKKTWWSSTDHPGQKFAQSVSCWMIYYRGCEQHSRLLKRLFRELSCFVAC